MSTEKSVFTSEIFYETASTNLTQNIIFSPVSIQTALALAYFGSNGKTADEFISGLKFDTNDREKISQKFNKILLNAEKSSMLRIANKLFANELYTFKSSFNDIAKKTFLSETENLNFSKSHEAVACINKWVEEKTNNKIKNLLTDSSVNTDTAMILVNAIYFKGEWVLPFSTDATMKKEFFNHGKTSVEIDVMYQDDKFPYGEIEKLNSTALEMHYKDSDLSMILILPNDRNGLPDLINKLKDYNLLELSDQLNVHDVDVFIPKFTVEFDIKFNEILQKMGMSTMFTTKANFSNLCDKPVKVSDVIHKAFINVNEAGSEAAAATYMKIVPMCLNLDQKKFEVNYPFVYLIKDKSNVYFIGHVTELN